MKSEKRVRWGGILLFSSLTLASLIGAPVYYHYYGFSRPEKALFIFYFVTTSLAITVGYHRFFSHATFKTNPVMQFLLLFFGAATFEQSALKWSSLHRSHHQFTDTDEDPYNIKEGFFYAHVGWIMFRKQHMDYSNVKDLMKSKLVMHQHEHYKFWSLIAGVLIPLLIGALTGHLLGAFVWSVALRLWLVFNSAFFINSFAHTFGTRPFDESISARDNWFGAFLTNGEGYHNFHHRFPNDYRNGIRWYHWDPTKWFIWILSVCGCANDLRITPAAQILEARLKNVSLTKSTS